MSEKLRDLILAEEKKGNVVFMGCDELLIMPLDKFIEQPTEGLLYDLNRLPEVIIGWIDDPKWVNDYAVYLVVTKLKADLEAIKGTLGEIASLENMTRIKPPEIFDNDPDCVRDDDGYVPISFMTKVGLVHAAKMAKKALMEHP